eukprot:gene15920-22054_t
MQLLGKSMSPVFQALEQAHTNQADNQSGAPSANGKARGITFDEVTTVTELPVERDSDNRSNASDADSKNKGMESGESEEATASGAEGAVKKKKKKLSPQEDFRQRQQKRNGAIPIEGTGLSFWYFDEDHPVRCKVYDLIANNIVIILLNCVVMTLENPNLDRDSTMGQAVYWADVGFTTLFGIEVIAKTFAFTFKAYIKDITNKVDFAIVVISVMVLTLEAIASDASAVQALRVLRAVKPLRMLTRSPGMRMVFKSLIMSLVAMGNVSIVLVMFFLIFAMLGTHLFMGLFYTCNDTSVANMTECVGDYNNTETGLVEGRDWHNQFPNFDNVGNSLFVTFIVASLNGYTFIMQRAMSTPEQKDEQPEWMRNPGAFFWFVGTVFVVAYALLNLYVGVIFSQFTRIRLMSQTGSAFLTSDQEEWAELTKMVFKMKPAQLPDKPKSKLHKIAFKITTSSQFEIAVMFIILWNIMCLSWSHYKEPASQTIFLNQVTVFVSEAILKIYSVGWRLYWKDDWNKLDFILALLAIIELAASNLQLNFLRALRVLRAQRLLRMLRVVKQPWLSRGANNVKTLIGVLVASIPGFSNVMALIILLLFMYSYVGVYLFTNVMWNSGINEHANFENFGMATILLIRIATMDNWSDVLLRPEDSACTSEDGNCGTYVAVAYFFTYLIFMSVILLNLFIAVVVETFEKVHKQDEWKLSPKDFVQLWAEFDDGSGTIWPKDLEELLLKLEPPLGLGIFADSKDVLRFVYDLDIPLVKGKVPFHKTAFELVKRVSQSNIPEGALKEALDKLVERFFKNLHNDEIFNFSVAVVAGKVQRKWRARMRAAKLRRKKEWRVTRTENIPRYTTIHLDKDAAIANFRKIREKEAVLANIRKIREEEKRLAEALGLPQELSKQQWRFNPKYTQVTELLEKENQARKLMNLMSSAFKPKNLFGGLFGNGVEGAELKKEDSPVLTQLWRQAKPSSNGTKPSQAAGEPSQEVFFKPKNLFGGLFRNGAEGAELKKEDSTVLMQLAKGKG